MAKQGGLGDNLYVGGYNLSGDIQAVGTVQGGPTASDFTTIDKSAMVRLGTLRDGSIEYTAFFNDATSAAHPVLAALPTADKVVTYCRGTSLGSPAAALVGKQIGYDGSRANDGGLTMTVQTQANSYGLDWGVQLTAGLRTDTTATSPATGVDTTASASFGGQAYLQVTAFTGTSVTVKIQDSADNATFADVTGLAFTAVTAAPASERIAISNTSTIRRYVRVVTTGTFTNAVFNVVLAKNESAGVLF